MADTYSVGQAAKLLSRSESTTRAMAERGDLDAEKVNGSWRIDQQAVHDLRQQMRGDPSADVLEGRFKEMLDRIEGLSRQYGEARATVALTEKAQSTLEAERRRLLSDLEREKERADRLEKENEILRAHNNRSWWSRIMGS